MDPHRFDAMTRTVGSRRGILAAALGGTSLFGLIDATAKKRRRRKQCWRKKIGVSCEDNCRFYKISNCKERNKRCKCPSDKTCMPNESCGLSCAATPCPEGSGCTCSTSDPRVCLAAFTNCEDVPTRCETTADCPFRFSCDDTPCGESGGTEKRCLPLCGYASLL